MKYIIEIPIIFSSKRTGLRISAVNYLESIDVFKMHVMTDDKLLAMKFDSITECQSFIMLNCQGRNYKAVEDIDITSLETEKLGEVKKAFRFSYKMEAYIDAYSEDEAYETFNNMELSSKDNYYDGLITCEEYIEELESHNNIG